MTNWFSSIGQAASGIDAARYGLNVVSQNIANADTEGYTRQQVQQAATDATVSAGLYTTRNVTNLMGGVRITGVDRAIDPVLDARVRDEHSRAAVTDTAAATLSDVEKLFPEPGTNGVAARLDEFWQSWGSLADHPGDAGVRTTVLRAASAAAGTLNQLSTSLDGVSASTANALSDDLTQANTAASQLAGLNDQIAVATATGQNANNLLDRRDGLLDTLGKLVGGVATLGANGAATVTVGGQVLVGPAGAGTVTADAAHTVSVSGTAVTLTGGSAAARVTALTTTIPDYRSRLDGVADALSAAGNAVQSGGYDLNGAAGGALFTGSGAAGITIALTDPQGLAASSTPGVNLDGGNALAAADRGTATDGPDARYRALVAQAGADSARSQQLQETQDAVVTNVDSVRASISGVSYDDEVSSLLTYQHAFQASSRVLTTIDQMLDTLINHTGVVGAA